MRTPLGEPRDSIEVLVDERPNAMHEPLVEVVSTFARRDSLVVDDPGRFQRITRGLDQDASVGDRSYIGRFRV
jgi:hypothetical protein